MSLKKYKRWLDRDKSPRTIQGYIHTITNFLKWVEKEGSGDPSNPSAEDVDEYIYYLTDEEYASSSIARHYHAIRSYFKFLKRLNELSDIIPPRVVVPEPDCIEEEEVTAILNTCESARDRALFILLFATGIRVGEIAELKVGDVDFDNRTLRVQREKKREGMITDYIPLEPEAVEALKGYWAELEVDRSWDGDLSLFNLTPQGVRWIMKNICKKAGVREEVSHPHALRHGRATQILRKGGRLEYIQKLLRHKSITTTQRYTHLVPEDLRVNIPPAFGDDDTPPQTSHRKKGDGEE